MLNRSTQMAFAAMAFLAEVYNEEGRHLSSSDIAESRKLQKPFVAKVLTQLSKAKLISGSPGPGGGYRLTRPPSEIALKDIAELFERPDDFYECPYGPNYCGNGPEVCPIHDEIFKMKEQFNKFLERTTLSGFQQNVRPPWP